MAEIDIDQIKFMYLTENPTPKDTYEVIKSVALQLDLSPNLVRKVLTDEGVLVMAEPTKEKAKRLSKAEAHKALIEIIESQQINVMPEDKALIEKMTGVAATYFHDILQAVIANYEE